MLLLYNMTLSLSLSCAVEPLLFTAATSILRSKVRDMSSNVHYIFHPLNLFYHPFLRSKVGGSSDPYLWNIVYKNETKRRALTLEALLYCHRVPTRTGKSGKMERLFSVKEQSGKFEQTGKVKEKHTESWKSQRISDKYYLLMFIAI